MPVNPQPDLNEGRGDLTGVVYEIDGDLIRVRLLDGRHISSARLVTDSFGYLRMDYRGLSVLNQDDAEVRRPELPPVPTGLEIGEEI